MADVGEVGPGGVGVLVDALLGGVGVGAAAEATVVEGEEVDSERMQGFQLWHSVGEGAFSIVEQEDRLVGVRGIGLGGYPPSGELRLAGPGVVEADFVVSEADGRRGRGDGTRGLEDDLPLALIEEQTEGEVGGDGGQGDDDEHGAEQPTSADQGLLLGERVFPAGRRSAGGLALRLAGGFRC